MRAIFADWFGEIVETFKFKTIGSDFLAGLTVAAVALPLNIALAVACGLPPSTGLIAGAIGGGIAALLGGSTLQVSGPAAALNIMVFAIAQKFGAPGVAMAAIFVGLIQLVLFMTFSGKVINYVPEVVLAGFMSGVGLKLLDNQIPEVLGFDYKVFELVQMTHRPVWLKEVSWLAVLCAIAIILLVNVTKQWKRFPAALTGISLITALSIYLNWGIERVGFVSAVLPTSSLPKFGMEDMIQIAILSFPLGILAGVESLLSAQAVDRISHAKKHSDPNLELFGQGVANVVTGVFSGMPVTGVVVRSSANVQSGGKTRLSSIIHSLILLFSILFFSEFIAKIPLAGLAGFLCLVGFRLIEVKTFVELLRHHKIEAAAFLVTAVGTVTGHLVSGLLAGLALAYFSHFLDKKKNKASLVKEELKEKGIRAIIENREVEKHPSFAHPEFNSNNPNWLSQIRDRTQISKSAFVHEQASVIGKVVLGDRVHIAAGSSVRADEGTPFYIGNNTNIQDGVVIHALKEKHVNVAGESWAVYVGRNVSMAHQALVHGPCYIGDDTFIGFKAIVHDSIVGSNCFIGMGAIVVGVEIPDRRFVPHGAVIDTAEKAESLPLVSEAQLHFNEDVVDVNKGLVDAYRKVSDEESMPATNSEAVLAQKFNNRYSILKF